MPGNKRLRRLNRREQKQCDWYGNEKTTTSEAIDGHFTNKVLDAWYSHFTELHCYLAFKYT